MLDERWSEEAEEIGSALRRMLATESSSARIRAAEGAEDGRDPALERHLDEFGLSELDVAPDLLARIAYEIGRAAASTAIVEAMAVRAVLGLGGAANGLDGPVPAALPRVVIQRDDGALVVVDNIGRKRRTTAGDWLTQPVAGPGETVGSAADADRIRRLASLVEAARLVGAGHALLEIGAAYAREREQFGKIIGTYQGVAHRLASTAGALDAADLLVRKAAFTALEHAGGDGAPAPIFAHMVRPKAIEAARLAATHVHQVFGGNGFAMEYDVQLYSRRIRSWANRGPRPGADLRAVARTVLDPVRRDALKLLWHYDEGMPLPRWAREVDRATG